MSLVEVLVVTLVISIVVAGVGGSSIEWLRAERLRSATHLLYAQLSLARTEAANRNRPCRMEFDAVTRRADVVDLGDPADATDDVTIASVTIDSRVELAIPTTGTPITMQKLDTTLFGATFAQDGSVSAGSGSIGLHGNGLYRRISVFAGGGVAVESWDGAAWVLH